jgi:anti-sigma regulatory factor (Ser/Thr protein kinase)
MLMVTLEIGAGQQWHAVQFYESDGELCEAVIPLLGAAVLDGGVAVAIATQSHRAVFLDGLRDSGVDVDQAFADGRLLALDAAETLGSFMPDGRIDADAFRDTVGALVHRSASRGRPLHLYGEMVSLLWEAGDIPAVIELEKLWNDLAGEVPFCLLCGYRSESAADPRLAHALGRVCALHSAAHPARLQPRMAGGSQPVEACSFPADNRGPQQARRFIDQVLWDWGYSGALAEDARLLISELATNAVRHAKSTFRVGARIERGHLRLSVRDESSVEPRMLEVAPEGPRGHGLRVVAALSEEWGFDSIPGGKEVWAKLRFDSDRNGIRAQPAGA